MRRKNTCDHCTGTFLFLPFSCGEKATREVRRWEGAAWQPMCEMHIEAHYADCEVRAIPGFFARLIKKFLKED